MKKQEPIELIHVSDIHFGSGEVHGPINPQTGLNVRLEDFCAAFTKCVDYALNLPADVFLFSGDAYRNASPEPIYQKLFAEQLRRLSQANIKTILVVGNHDQIFKSTGSHSMSVFQSLGVPNLIIIDRPQLITIDTTHGALQLIGVPYVTRHILMTNEDYANLSHSEIDKLLATHLQVVLEDLYSQLDPTLPSVATAHIMLDSARAGAEQELLVGYTSSFPLSLFTNPSLEYVALGHVHKHQILHKKNPVITYAGSIERVDFSEESEDKGFIHARVAKSHTTHEFISIDPRPFVTVDIDCTKLGTADDTITDHIINNIQKKLIPDCVLRVRYKLLDTQSPHVDLNKIRQSCRTALTLHLKPDIVPTQRESRIPDLTESSTVTPLSALEKYLDTVAPERKERLLSVASDLIDKTKEND